jgi:DNA segregation ATPase FtsK/SpoIIIE, S-DNA-T family
MKKSWIQIKPEVKGLAWLSVGLILFISLYTFDSNDRIFFEGLGSGLKPVKNACGHLGAFLSVLCIKVLGLGAYGLVLTCLSLSYRGFTNKKSAVEQYALGFLFIVFTSIALELYLNLLFSLDITNAGGWVGLILGSYAINAFNTTGTAVIILFSYLILLALAFDHPIKTIYKISMHGYVILKSIIMNALSSIKKTKPLEKLNIKGMFSSLSVTFQSKEDLNDLKQMKDKTSKDAFIEEDNDFETDDVNVSETENAIPISPIVKMALKRRQNQKEDSYKIESFKRDAAKKISHKIKDEDWEMPSLDLLQDPPSQFEGMSEEEIREKSNLLVSKLEQFSVKGKIVGVKSGPAVTLFEFRPNADIKISKITELADDLSLALASESVRIIAPIPGRDVVGIETSNSKRDTVFIKDVVSVDTFWKDDMKLPIGLGRRADGYPMVVDLRKMPHLLVAGSTGSGKSVFVVSMIAGLLLRHSPKKLKLILVDPKQVDLAAFNDLPHLLIPPIRDSKKAVNALRWAISEMDKRYRSMSKFKVRDLEGFNEKVGVFTEPEIQEYIDLHEIINTEAPMKSYYFQPLPYIAIIVEEFGDLMAVDKINVEHAIVRLAQMARACGIHLVLAMQSPRKDVVTGLIKTNIPGRISFKVASKMDSRVILDESGAERLLSRGDMLFQSPGISKPLRAHGAYVSEEEIERITKVWKDQAEPQYDERAMRAVDGSSSSNGGSDGLDSDHGGGDDSEEFDDRYDEILEQVSVMKEVSASMLQRKFRLGYPRAARMIEVFEQQGVVGPANGSKPRKVLINSLKDL